MKVERIATSAKWKHDIRTNLSIGRAARDAARRRAMAFPFRARWAIVKGRHRFTWHELWVDLVYLMRG